jgi:hypothetical protein
MLLLLLHRRSSTSQSSLRPRARGESAATPLPPRFDPCSFVAFTTPGSALCHAHSISAHSRLPKRGMRAVPRMPRRDPDLSRAGRPPGRPAQDVTRTPLRNGPLNDVRRSSEQALDFCSGPEGAGSPPPEVSAAPDRRRPNLGAESRNDASALRQSPRHRACDPSCTHLPAAGAARHDGSLDPVAAGASTSREQDVERTSRLDLHPWQPGRDWDARGPP